MDPSDEDLDRGLMKMGEYTRLPYGHEDWRRASVVHCATPGDAVAENRTFMRLVVDAIGQGIKGGEYAELFKSVAESLNPDGTLNIDDFLSHYVVDPTDPYIRRRVAEFADTLDFIRCELELDAKGPSE